MATLWQHHGNMHGIMKMNLSLRTAPGLLPDPSSILSAAVSYPTRILTSLSQLLLRMPAVINLASREHELSMGNLSFVKHHPISFIQFSYHREFCLTWVQTDYNTIEASRAFYVSLLSFPFMSCTVEQ